MSTVYSLRIPKKLKEALQSLEKVDWQAEIRQFLEQKVRQHYLRLELDEARKLRTGMRRTVSSAEIIRADRKNAH